MPCPKCGSHHIWDDNLAWGCHECDWFTTGDVQNVYDRRDEFLTHEEWRERQKAKAAITESSDDVKDAIDGTL